MIFVRSFESVVKVNQVEDKNQNWENHPGHLREGAQFNFSQKVSFISLTRDGCQGSNDKKKDLRSSTNQIQFPGSSPQPAPAHILPHLFFKGQLTGPLKIELISVWLPLSRLNWPFRWFPSPSCRRIITTL